MACPSEEKKDDCSSGGAKAKCEIRSVEPPKSSAAPAETPKDKCPGSTSKSSGGFFGGGSCAGSQNPCAATAPKDDICAKFTPPKPKICCRKKFDDILVRMYLLLHNRWH